MDVNLMTFSKEYRHKLWKTESDAVNSFSSSWKKYPLFVSRYLVGNGLFAFLLVGWAFIWCMENNKTSVLSMNKAILVYLWTNVALLFLFKWMTGYYNCTYGYCECKIRKCERKDGFINNFIDRTYSLMDASPPYVIIFTLVMSIVLNLVP